MMSLHIYPDYESLSKGLAEWLAGDICLTLKQKERYSFVLSGGGTPQRLYEVLAGEFADRVDWEKIDFFWGDERYVPFEDERNNGKMAYEYLLSPLNIPENNIYRMHTGPTPEQAAADYESSLKQYFKDQNNSFTFDFALLGMGSDSHTLSIFPDSPLRNNQTDWVRNVLNKKENLQRITMLPWLVNQSVKIAFMAKGEDKQDALRQVLHGTFNPAVYPAQLIKSDRGEVLWFVDEAANG